MVDLKKRLRNGELLVGTMISELRNPNIAYMLAQNGFDFFILDNEHGAYSPETISDIIAAARGADLPVVVRIPEIRRETILKPLDSGAAGLPVPQVNTKGQAEEIIFHSKYPPLGNRGAALRRPHSLYKRVVAGEYLRQANEETFIAVQAETPQAIANLEEITSVPGIDAVFVGPFDLSVSLGIPGDLNHPREIEAIEKVVEICQRRGIFSGIHLFDLAALKTWVNKGMRFVTYSSDVALLADAARNSVSELKTMIKK
ncbi:MAG: aldolase/citrate lyase family protein [Desulfobacterota bacterium]|nr:aldolase/citrate lyase family protein [Thermodesulfobacteriota bacterium]